MVIWKSRLPQVTRVIESDLRHLHVDLTEMLEDSIINGSAVTGAPGQPEDLRDGQWSVVRVGAMETVITTDEVSALSVEDGYSHKFGGPITLNSPIGGSHSLALTHQNAGRLIERAVSRVKRSDNS